MDSVRSTVFLQEFLADPKNRELFGKFVKKYQPRLKRCCLGRGLQDADADDLTATILLRFCQRDVFDDFVFQSKAKFYGWLETVVRNDVLTFLRNRSRKPDSWSLGNPDAQDALQQTSAGVVGGLKSVCEDDLARVEAGYARVKERVGEKTWRIFEMLVFENRRVEEVMEHFGMSKDAVYAARARVKRLLREELHDLHDFTGDGK